MLHPQVLADLLDDEVEDAGRRLGGRADGLAHDGRFVRCRLAAPDGAPVWLRLDGAAYDGEPFRVEVCDLDDVLVPAERWPTGLMNGAHPVHGRPFTCVRGTWEYHTHPSHHQERWDVHRSRLRLADLLDHLLRKVGRP
jgi:hypothetical protein